jgi:preprotein translocase subunit Sss1
MKSNHLSDRIMDWIGPVLIVLGLAGFIITLVMRLWSS